MLSWAHYPYSGSVSLGYKAIRRARDEAVEFGSCAGSTGFAGEGMRLLGPPPETRNG